MSIALRPYQSAAIDAARGLIRTHKRLLLTLPTGGGKTVIAAQVIAGAIAKGRHALFLAHRREIVAQSWCKLLEAGVPPGDVGVIMGNGRITNPLDGMELDARRPNARAQVASVQTLARRARPPADVVFVDEAHHAAAKSWSELLKHYADRGAVIIGLSATPERADGRGLSDIFDHLHTVATVTELIEGGYLVEPEGFSIPPPDLSKVKTTGGDYDIEQLGEAMDRAELVGRIVEHWQELACGRTTVVFATTVAHSVHITTQFRAAGITAEHLDGETPQAERDAILGRLASGETTVVSNCGVLTEGFDCPRVKVVVLARPSQSLSLVLQMEGRALRPWNDVPALIIDHAGCVRRFGMPQRKHRWSLDGRPKGARRSSSDSDPNEKFCPACSFRVLRGVLVCPKCQHEWTAAEIPAETDGRLVKVTAEQLEEAARMDIRREINRAIGRVAATWEAAGWSGGDSMTSLNRALFQRFRQSRTKMSEGRLNTVLAYVQSGEFASDNPPPAVPVFISGASETGASSVPGMRRAAPLADLGIERQRPPVARALPPVAEPEETVSWAL